MKKIIILLIALLLPLQVGAVDLTAQDQYKVAYSVWMDEEVKGDLVVVAPWVEVYGHIKGNLVVVSLNAKINAEVDGDVFILSTLSDINGKINGSVRNISAWNYFNAQTESDVLLIAKDVSIMRNSSFNSLLLYAGDAKIFGTTRGPSWINADNVYLGGSMSGTTVVNTTENLTYDKNFRSEGDLYYTARQQDMGINEMVQGQINYKKYQTMSEYLGVSYLDVPEGYRFYGWMYLYLLTLIVAGILVFVMPDSFVLMRDGITHGFFKNILRGLLAWLAVEVLAVLCFVSVIGIPFALLLWILLCLAYWLATVYVSAWLVMSVIRLAEYSRVNLMIFVFIGITIFYLLAVIPYYLGLILQILLVGAGVGAILGRRVTFHVPGNGSRSQVNI